MLQHLVNVCDIQNGQMFIIFKMLKCLYYSKCFKDFYSLHNVPGSLFYLFSEKKSFNHFFHSFSSFQFNHLNHHIMSCTHFEDHVNHDDALTSHQNQNSDQRWPNGGGESLEDLCCFWERRLRRPHFQPVQKGLTIFSLVGMAKTELRNVTDMADISV